MPGGSFWTVCPSCCYIHQYGRIYESRHLRCPNCFTVFQAQELDASPPVVPGTHMYYCVWGVYPLGFPDPKGDWTPFVTVERPRSSPPTSKAKIKREMARMKRSTVATAQSGPPHPLLLPPPPPPAGDNAGAKNVNRGSNSNVDEKVDAALEVAMKSSGGTSADAGEKLVKVEMPDVPPGFHLLLP